MHLAGSPDGLGTILFYGVYAGLVRKKLVFDRNTLQLAIFIDLSSLRHLSTSTDGSNMSGIAGPIYVRKNFNHFRSS